MSDPNIKILLESWNFCNYAGKDANPSPRYSDCFDYNFSKNVISSSFNSLVYPQPIPGYKFESKEDYALKKELFLGDLCSSIYSSSSREYSFWTFMLKNGVLIKELGLCEKMDGVDRRRLYQNDYRDIPMNHPKVFHKWTESSGTKLSGSFYGTWDLILQDFGGKQFDEFNVDNERFLDKSFFNVTWEYDKLLKKKIFYQYLRTNDVYDWLMLYQRSDGINFMNGGCPYVGRGVLLEKPNYENLRLKVFLNVTVASGFEHLQFYLPEISGCWKNSGKECENLVRKYGNEEDDVTRYVCFIASSIDQQKKVCSKKDIGHCPRYHVFLNGSLVYSNDTDNFPYECYYYYCAPPNAKETSLSKCDPYSNPIPQEIIQLLPCSEWDAHGFPKAGEKFVNNPKLWDLDISGLRNRIYFFGDDSSNSIKFRDWLSFEIGPEMFGKHGEIEWITSEWDVVV